MLSRIPLQLRQSVGTVSRHYATTMVATEGWGSFTKPEKNDDGFYLDTRRGQRETLLNEWVSRNGRTYRFEIADEADFNMNNAFWIETFHKTSNIVEKLKPEEHELYPLMVPMAESMMEQKDIILCFEDDRLVGNTMGGFHDGPQFDGLLGRGELGAKNPKVVLEDNYAAEVAKLPYSPKVNIIMAFIRTCFFQALPFLAKTTRRVGILEITAIHPALQAEGIGSVIAPLMVDRLGKQQSDIVISLAAAAGTYKISKKMGVDLLYKVPFDQFKIDGKVIYEDLCDGATSAAMVGRRFK